MIRISNGQHKGQLGQWLEQKAKTEAEEGPQGKEWKLDRTGLVYYVEDVNIQVII